MAGVSKFPWNVRLDYGLVVDGRDGRHYKTIEIDSLEWLAENVKFVTDSSWCYDHDTTNCAIYGRLYRGSEAAKACPKGWHLPTADEWRSLLRSAGEGHALTRLTATEGWVTPNIAEEATLALSKWINPLSDRPTKSVAKKLALAQAEADAAAAAAAARPKFVPDDHSDDRFGFRLLPAGMRIVPMPMHPQPKVPYGESSAVETKYSKSHPVVGKEFGRMGAYANLWSATEIDTSLAPEAADDMGINILSSLGTMDPFGFSVRCVEKIGR
ncbi:MAG: hypothetical protein RL173_3558 [Fibrobacterota bacterium]